MVVATRIWPSPAGGMPGITRELRGSRQPRDVDAELPLNVSAALRPAPADRPKAGKRIEIYNKSRSINGEV